MKRRHQLSDVVVPALPLPSLRGKLLPCRMRCFLKTVNGNRFARRMRQLSVYKPLDLIRFLVYYLQNPVRP